MPNSTPGPWHYEGHYILTDLEPQEIIAQMVKDEYKGLIASAPTQQAKIEALADALEFALTLWNDPLANVPSAQVGDASILLIRGKIGQALAALKAAGRIP